MMMEQDCKCYYCKCQMTLRLDENDQPLHNTATFEHLIDRSNGGNDKRGNLVLACHYCNDIRGHSGREENQDTTS